MEKLRILIIDDDPKIASSLKRSLAYDGYEVTLAVNGLEGLDLIPKAKPDVIILDVMMPVMDGIEACPYIRQLTDAPILMLTAKDEVSDKVKGLGAGADDYLVKPFAYEEFMARLKALQRRSGLGRADGKVLVYGDLSLDLGRRTANRGERTIELSTKEFELLRLFISNPREVLTRDFLMDRVWGWDFEGNSNVLEVYVRYLREKLEEAGEPRLIFTVRGSGYVLK